MAERRLLGIDLGVTTAHTVVILEQAGQVLGRRRCRPTVAGTRLEAVVEPTGPAWLPVAIFFAGRGHTVFRVPSAKAADLRRFLFRRAKSNAIDAATLARLPLVDPGGVQPLELPDGPRASLDRRGRTCQWLTEQATSHKVRIRELARQLFPTLNDVLTCELRSADLAVLEGYGDPRALLAAGHERVAALRRAGSTGRMLRPRSVDVVGGVERVTLDIVRRGLRRRSPAARRARRSSHRDPSRCGGVPDVGAGEIDRLPLVGCDGEVARLGGGDDQAPRGSVPRGSPWRVLPFLSGPD